MTAGALLATCLIAPALALYGAAVWRWGEGGCAAMS